MSHTLFLDGTKVPSKKTWPEIGYIKLGLKWVNKKSTF